MKSILYTFLLLLSAAGLHAQTYTLSGIIIDSKGKPVKGASIYLDNTLDGGTSDSAGHFTFTTSEKGAQVLAATAVGYNASGQPLNITGNIKDIQLQLKASAQQLDGVTVTAGAFEAGTDKGKTILSSLDIVTTAGSQADVVRAIQTLPGTQQQGTQSGLFVRGGDATEAAIIVDGLIAQDAFATTAPGVAGRSRFSPFQFRGISFSSGGYSARYGQAMSSVLELTTLDMPDKTTVNLGLNMAGIYASGSKLWKNSSGDVTASYFNLSPFYGVASTNVDYYDVPKGSSGSARYAWKPNKNGILKVLTNFTNFTSGVQVPNPDEPGATFKYGIANTNAYLNVSYNQRVKEKWNFFTAAGYALNIDKINAGPMPITQHNDRGQFRFEAKRYLANKLNILVGTELQHFTYRRKIDLDTAVYNLDFTETQTAGFLEAEWSPQRWIAIKPGVRAEHSDLLNQNTLAPRLALAIRSGMWGQIGFSAGSFYQLPDVPYLQYGYRPGMQQAIHYIANYQWIKGDRTFRAEVYYKDYRNLVLERRADTFNANSFRNYYGMPDNGGSGYAKGLEIFWRDKKLIKNVDYWISYSYIDTRRLYRNYIAEAQPEFISDHNVSLVTKYYIEKWTTQINMTYSYATGRPYYNPSNPVFLGDRTPDYHNLSLAINYLTHVKKWFTVIYGGVDNALDQHNVFGYRYSTDGSVRYPQYPALFRSYFIGVNFSLTEFNKDEL